MNEQKFNHVCFVCGAAYNFCKNCSIADIWRDIADTKQHYDIHRILELLRNQEIQNDEAVEQFAEIGVKKASDLGDVLPEVRAAVQNILNADKQSTDITSLKKSK